jgi:hypothetical protein
MVLGVLLLQLRHPSFQLLKLLNQFLLTLVIWFSRRGGQILLDQAGDVGGDALSPAGGSLLDSGNQG